MATKEELEDELNERLNLDIEWSQMKKGDLETIRDGLDDEEFIKKFLAQYANTVTGDMVQDEIENWEPGQALTMLEMIQSDDVNPIDMFM